MPQNSFILNLQASLLTLLGSWYEILHAWQPKAGQLMSVCVCVRGGQHKDRKEDELGEGGKKLTIVAGRKAFKPLVGAVVLGEEVAAGVCCCFVSGRSDGVDGLTEYRRSTQERKVRESRRNSRFWQYFDGIFGR